MSQRILIVDDEESLRFTFKTFLSAAGYQVRIASHLAEARELLETFLPDLVFIDVLLGESLGSELLKDLNQAGSHVPAVMITGQPNIETAREAVQLGAYDYLPKPVRKETLLRVAAKALEHKDLQDERRELIREKDRYSNLLKAILTSVQDAIVAVDTDLRIVQANRAMGTLCRKGGPEAVGEQFQTVAADCSQSCFPLLERVLTDGLPLAEHRVECRHQNQQPKTVGVVASPLRDKEGVLMGAVLVMRDLTRLEELERAVGDQHGFQDIIGRSQAMQEVFQLLDSVSDTETTVLITGESGTGKELVAKAIHSRSSRSERPLTTINCAALSESLLESELFGHVKGAFTGAVKDRAGWFEAANGGTIFLDEVGELSTAMQKKLLRVLQERSFERVGDTRTRTTDVRVIAATNQDLRSQIQAGAFRQDLFYRLKVVEVPLPPLRQRREDIPLLVAHFCSRFNRRFDKAIQGVTDEVLRLFMAYEWPGNIRELEHVLEHAYVLSQGRTISVSHLPTELNHGDGQGLERNEGQDGLRGLSAASIQEALERTDWNKAKAARILGVSRQTLYRHIKSQGLARDIR